MEATRLQEVYDNLVQSNATISKQEEVVKEMGATLEELQEVLRWAWPGSSAMARVPPDCSALAWGWGG